MLGSSQPDPIAPSAITRPIQSMDPQLKDIQPGGGVVIRLELLWGYLRRAFLKIFRSGYVRRMAACRKGDFNPCPFEVLDPRDLKFYRNQGGYYWEPADDPFQSRDQLPFARVGLAELMLMTASSALVAILLFGAASESSGLLKLICQVGGLASVVIGILIAWFFRNPRREVPIEPGMVVSPADGKVVEIEDLEFDEFIGGPAKKIGIFLSIFNVHINRAPVAGQIVGLRYRPGKYLNALRPESARENEQLAVMMEATDGSGRGFVVRQITGAIARRIVCWLKPGDQLKRGEQFGMIKLGSRTELLMPAEPGLRLRVSVGDTVCAGSSVIAVFSSDS
ncbi:MAG: phosphatidylserine decarboxylase family protein [Planctomyces sp.]|jgi:phosphatidylserine decarboxylase